MSIKIDLSLILFILIFCFTSQIEIYLLLLLFALIHEIGHLCVGMCLGFRPQEFKIHPIGMKIEFKPQYEGYNQKIKRANILAVKRGIIAVAGPLTNFIIICILVIVQNINPQILEWNIGNINYITIIYANFLIGIFNLIPIYPLDGGRILKEIFYITVGLKKAYTYTYRASKITLILLTVLSSIAILYLQNISILIILAYLWGLVLIQRKQYYTKKKIEDMTKYIKLSNIADYSEAEHSSKN